MKAAPTTADLAEHPCMLLSLAPEAAVGLLDSGTGLAGGADDRSQMVDGLRSHGGFDLLPIAVQERLAPDPFFQVAALRGAAMHTATTLRIAADPAWVLAALTERPWSWWRHGKVVGWQRRDDGGVRFSLFPMWLRSPARLGIELEPPVVVEERSTCGAARPKTLLAARFSGDFRGPGRYEIVDVPGGAVLRSVFDGVERAGFTRLMPPSMVLGLHARAECGGLGFPFPAGTGFGGLRDALSTGPSAPRGQRNGQ